MKRIIYLFVITLVWLPLAAQVNYVPNNFTCGTAFPVNANPPAISNTQYVINSPSDYITSSTSLYFVIEISTANRQVGFNCLNPFGQPVKLSWEMYGPLNTGYNCATVTSGTPDLQGSNPIFTVTESSNNCATYNQQSSTPAIRLSVSTATGPPTPRYYLVKITPFAGEVIKTVGIQIAATISSTVATETTQHCSAYTEGVMSPCPTNIVCSSPITLCSYADISMPCFDECPFQGTVFYVLNVQIPGTTVSVNTNSPSGSPTPTVTISSQMNYGPCDPALNDPNTLLVNTQGTTASHTFAQTGLYLLRIQNLAACTALGIEFDNPDNCNPPEPVDSDTCRNCIGSYAPEPGKTYILTAWAKEDGASPNKLSYDQPFVSVLFEDAGGSNLPVNPQFFPAGSIIDGWQRIEGTFTIPVNAAYIDIELNTLSGFAYFDDIRVHPFDGSMVTYVYDPVSMRLVAQLDERNYSTMYEYDEEGRLKRVKKETEKGIMTIQETTTSTVKDQ